MLGTEDEEKIKALEEYSELIGIAFQAQDDVLDLIGDKEQLGKHIGRDIKEGRKTLAVIHAFNDAYTIDAKRLMNILSSKNPSEEEIQEAINILKKSGSIDYTRKFY